MDLRDLKIIVTGGARGLGDHFVRRLLEGGAKVAAGDVDESSLRALPDGVHRRTLDVSDERQCESFVQWASAAMGGVNALINNAGILRDCLLVKTDRTTGSIRRMAKKDWDDVIAVNLTGAVLMTREVVANMLEAGARPGVIINISSVSRHGNRGQTNYVASKAGLAANTVTWAREFAAHGIRVGAIAPGMVETSMTQAMNQRTKDALVAGVPLGRIGQPEDIWMAAKFIIECDYFTGRIVEVDGGIAM